MRLQNMIKILIFVLLVSAISFPVTAWASPQTNEELTKEVKELKNGYNFYKDQTKSIQQHEERKLDKFIDFHYIIIGIIVGGTGVVFAFFGWSTRRELRTTIENKKNKFENEIKNKISIEEVEFKKEIDKKYNEFYDKISNETNKKIDYVKRSINSLSIYENYKILAIKTEGDDLVKSLCKVENNKRKIEYVEFYDGFLKNVNFNDYDIVIYQYKKDKVVENENDEKNKKRDGDFKNLIDTLNKQGKPPLLAYYPGSGHHEDKELLDEYLYGTFCNSSITIATHVYTVSQVFRDSK